MLSIVTDAFDLAARRELRFTAADYPNVLLSVSLSSAAPTATASAGRGCPAPPAHFRLLSDHLSAAAGKRQTAVRDAPRDGEAITRPDSDARAEGRADHLQPSRPRLRSPRGRHARDRRRRLDHAQGRARSGADPRRDPGRRVAAAEHVRRRRGSDLSRVRVSAGGSLASRSCGRRRRPTTSGGCASTCCPSSPTSGSRRSRSRSSTSTAARRSSSGSGSKPRRRPGGRSATSEDSGASRSATSRSTRLSFSWRTSSTPPLSTGCSRATRRGASDGG